MMVADSAQKGEKGSRLAGGSWVRNLDSLSLLLLLIHEKIFKNDL